MPAIANRVRGLLGRVRGWTGSVPATPAEVNRAYQLLLNRYPENAGVVEGYLSARVSVPELYRKIARSPEFGSRQSGESAAALEACPAEEQILRSFECYTGEGCPGFVTDFLGTRTRTAFIRGLERVDGCVESYPDRGNFHGAAIEWAGVLRAVLDAHGTMVAVELGTGWGPWLVAAAAAARQRGIADIRLVGVEGAASHVAFLRQHFLDNGLDPEAHTLLHGVAADADGEMEFPELADPAAEYGGTLAAKPLMPRLANPTLTKVRAISLPTLLEPFDFVDLIHIDIQGSEFDVVRASRVVLKAKVRRLVIGTHGRAIEQSLLEELSTSGWVLEADRACRYRRTAPGGPLVLAEDGCQVWRNPAR